jgi:methionine-rich copper-binding protein CopC
MVGSARTVVLAAALVLAAASARAHSEKEAVVPAADATLAETPSEIAMTFDQPMRIARITLTDADGRRFELERGDGMQPVRAFSAAPEALPPGDYTVEWRGLASDGHTMSGAWSFRVR